jgi:hypothetical protein
LQHLSGRFPPQRCTERSYAKGLAVSGDVRQVTQNRINI